MFVSGAFSVRLFTDFAITMVSSIHTFCMPLAEIFGCSMIGHWIFIIIVQHVTCNFLFSYGGKMKLFCVILLDTRIL